MPQLLDMKRKPSSKTPDDRAEATSCLGCLQRAEGARASAAGGPSLEDPYEYHERKWAEMKVSCWINPRPKTRHWMAGTRAHHCLLRWSRRFSCVESGKRQESSMSTTPRTS
eukprot:2230176-Rhodomonas_salina.1